MPPRLPELIKRARRLALDRDRLIQELARDWVAALKGQGFSPRDLEELWAGLTEEAVRRLAKQSPQSAGAETIRREANEVIARVRERVEGELTDSRVEGRVVIEPGVVLERALVLGHVEQRCEPAPHSSRPHCQHHHEPRRPCRQPA